MKIAKTAGVITILNPAPATKLPIGMLELCDFVTPNEIETESLTGIKVETDADAERAAASLHEMGVKTPVITLGERGAFLYGHGLVPSFQVGQVVETTGAGDAFNGGLAAGLSEGRSALDAVKIGSAVAGISVTRPGTAPSMPSREEVNELIDF